MASDLGSHLGDDVMDVPPPGYGAASSCMCMRMCVCLFTFSSDIYGRGVSTVGGAWPRKGKVTFARV